MNIIAKGIVAGTLLLGATYSTTQAAEACYTENAHHLASYYTVTSVKGTAYIAKNTQGKSISFNQQATPVALKKGNRVRAFIEQGEVLTAELIAKPLVGTHKVVKVTKKGSITTYTAKHIKTGQSFTFANKHVEAGKVLVTGSVVLVEFDPIFPVNIIKVTKK